MTLGAYILFHNEETLARLCIDHIKPFVDELVLVDHGSTDGTREILNSYTDEKTKVYAFDYSEPVDIGWLRTQCYRLMRSDWILNCDADEIYPEVSMLSIREFVKRTDAISARVSYKNLAWRYGYAQKDFGHFPDRLYKREVVDYVKGILPLDMHYIKKEYLLAPNKKKGEVGILEYDNQDDKSFENPRQPILDIWFYHLARTRGYNQELTKNLKYQHNMHPDWTDEQCLANARINQWTTGLYDIEKIDVPFEIPPIKNPKVSVVIPNFQYKQYIEECVESVKKQTYPAHEIIICDDGSHDNSQETIEKIPGIIPILKENGGVASARNAGAGRATGDCLIFLDADDTLKPDYIEKTVNKMLETKAQIVSTDLEFFGDQTGVHAYPPHSHETMLKWQNIPSACALIDRRVFELTGGFDITAWYEDWDFFLRCYQLGFDFAKVDEPLFNYRKHGESRIDILDAKQEFGFNQLREKYGIQR